MGGLITCSTSLVLHILQLLFQNLALLGQRFEVRGMAGGDHTLSLAPRLDDRPLRVLGELLARLLQDLRVFVGLSCALLELPSQSCHFDLVGRHIITKLPRGGNFGIGLQCFDLLLPRFNLVFERLNLVGEHTNLSKLVCGTRSLLYEHIADELL